MANEKLSYEEWRERMSVVVTDEVRNHMKKFHNLNADEEVEKALKKEYEVYINGEQSNA